MLRVAEFEKVSFKQFKSGWEKTFADHIEEIRELYDTVKLPLRASVGSAGYDFFTPIAITLDPGEQILIPTGICVKIEDGWFLAIMPRSGLGFKYRLQLDNTIGVIDSDYYYSNNEGHIFIKITNDSKTNKKLNIKAGEAFCQGVFLPFGITLNDDATAIRNGGLGSTSK